LSQSLLKTVQSRSAKGATPEAEVKRAKAALVRAELQLAASMSQFERQKVTLAQFWGVSDPAFTTLSGTLFQYREAEKFDQLFARIQSSPSLQVFLTETRVQEANLTLAKANARSDLTWQIGVRRMEESSDTAFVAGISVPLFSGRRNQGGVRAAEAQRDSAATAEKAALLRLHSELFQAFTLRAQSIDAVSRIKGTAIPALESALELTQRAYRNGRYRYQDLIAAQQELLMAKQSLIESASTALISQAVIEELTGQALNP
jgi:cobalt-zinc-cadmium efflux system outer membrane protein